MLLIKIAILGKYLPINEIVASKSKVIKLQNPNVKVSGIGT